MTGGWKIATIAVGILALALAGGLIYATFFTDPDPTDSDYVTMLGADYDNLLSRVGAAERLVEERDQRIVDIEGTRAAVAEELEASREEVIILGRELDNQRRLAEEARRAIGESYITSVRIGEASERAYDKLWVALDILERVRSGDTDPEG